MDYRFGIVGFLMFVTMCGIWYYFDQLQKCERTIMKIRERLSFLGIMNFPWSLTDVQYLLDNNKYPQHYRIINDLETQLIKRKFLKGVLNFCFFWLICLGMCLILLFK